jgi:hypothetical protein
VWLDVAATHFASITMPQAEAEQSCAGQGWFFLTNQAVYEVINRLLLLAHSLLFVAAAAHP